MTVPAAYLSGAGWFVMLVWLPGLVFRYVRLGLRGQDRGLGFGHALVEGAGLGASMWLLASLVSWTSPLDVLLAFAAWARGGFEAFASSPGFGAGCMYISGVYGVGLLGGAFWRLMDARGKPLSLQPLSALDVAFFRLRNRGVQPEVRVRFRSGDNLEGRCAVYTFTEPREMLLRIGGGAGRERFVWVTINHSEVAAVDIDVPEGSLAPVMRPHWTARLAAFVRRTACRAGLEI